MTTPRNTGHGPGRRGRIARVASAVGTAALLAGLGTLAACTDSPSAPAPGAAPTRPHLSTTVLSEPIRLNGLVRNVALRAPMTASATIGPAGGEIKIKEAGFYLAVPVGAVTGPTVITVTALPGDMVAYEFQPHGLVFASHPKFEQTLKDTNWDKIAKDATVRGAYFKDKSQLDETTDTALIDELLPVEVDSKTGKLRMALPHFSGYMVAWGAGL